MREIEKALMLRTIDILWMDHLDNMDHLRDSVRLCAYGQKDPLVEYKNEGHRLFRALLGAIESNVARMIYKVTIAKEAATDYGSRTTARHIEAAPGMSLAVDGSQSAVDRHLGRNDPCWCGNGLKYKKCHGR